MAIHIHNEFLFYWVVSILFEAIYIFVMYKRAVKYIKNNPEVSQSIKMFKEYYLQSPSIKWVYHGIVSPAGFIVGMVLLIILSPFIFPFSLLSSIKKLVGYKSNLEKDVEAEKERFEKSQKESEEFMKSEGCPPPNDEQDQPDKNSTT